MSRLRPMTSAEFTRWRAQAVPAYAADKVRIGRWSEQESLAEAEKEFSALLPQGQQTPGHVLFTIESNSGLGVGALWVAREERAAGPIGFIYDLVIWPDHQRQGHATSAMRALEREAVTLGFGGWRCMCLRTTRQRKTYTPSWAMRQRTSTCSSRWRTPVAPNPSLKLSRYGS